MEETVETDLKTIQKVQFELSTEKVQEIAQLLQETDLRTKKELFNNALTLFKWAVNQRKAGKIIAAVDEKQEKYKEITMPALDFAAGQ